MTRFLLLPSTLIRNAVWLRMAFALVLLLGAAFGSTTFGADSLSDSATAVADELDAKLVNDSRAGVATDEVNANLKWVFWALWLAVPMLVYGIMIPTIIMKAKANDMDAVKSGVISLVLGSVLYFGVLAVFFG
jgi:hypothetical protein